MPKRRSVLMMILITLVPGLFFDYPGIDIRMSYGASSGIVNRKRSERYVETHREIETSTTKNSGMISFAYK